MLKSFSKYTWAFMSLYNFNSVGDVNGNIAALIWGLFTSCTVVRGYILESQKSSVGVKTLEKLEHGVRFLRADPLGPGGVAWK